MKKKHLKYSIYFKKYEKMSYLWSIIFKEKKSIFKLKTSEKRMLFIFLEEGSLSHSFITALFATVMSKKI